MDLPISAGLYAPLKDVLKALARRRAQGLQLRVEAVALGESTRVIVTASCKPGGEQIVVRTCRAERYEGAYDACAGPEPVSTKAVRFSPTSAVTVQPGGIPCRWEAHVLNHQLRQEALEGNRAATESVYRGHAPEVLALQAARAQRFQQPPRSVVGRLWQALETEEGVRVRAVLETVNGDVVTTADVLVPPQVHVLERLMATLRRQDR